MSDFKFDCPHCNQSLEAPEEMLGEQINCPACNGAIKIPAPAAKFEQSAPSLATSTTAESPSKAEPMVSPDSPDGAIDKTLLSTLLKDLQLGVDEELFFLGKTVTVAVLGWKTRCYNLMVSSRRVLAIDKDKDGKISRKEYVFENITRTDVDKGFINNTLNIVLAALPDQHIKFDFTNNVEMCHLEAIVDYIKKNKQVFAAPVVDTGPLSAIERLQFRKFISEQSGMNIQEVDSYIESISDSDKEGLIIAFRNQIGAKTSEGAGTVGSSVTTVNIVNDNSSQPECPKCGSKQTTFNRQGFSAGKAVAGVLLTGGIGLLAGGFGKNKILIACMKCGHKWKVG